MNDADEKSALVHKKNVFPKWSYLCRSTKLLYCYARLNVAYTAANVFRYV
jgi:hypothetical protein